MILTDERATNCVKAALLWMRSHNVKWLKTEEKIYSLKHDYAGTMDGLAYVDSCTDPACCTEQFTHRLCLIDWKSSNQLKTEYCFQTAAYQQALQEEFSSPIESRWVLRLGKSEEEAGKFEPWFLSNKDFVTDLDAYLACLSLTRLVDTTNERMKGQKSSIRAVKKEQRETAKALAKEQAKLQKALDKAAAKIAKEAEKIRIKAEAKAERERLKAEKKMGVTHRVEVEQTVNLPLLASNAGSIPAAPTNPQEEPCTSTSKDQAPLKTEESTLLASSCLTESSTKSQPTLMQPSETPKQQPEAQSIISTVAAESSMFETETYTPTFKLPMEG